jgi:hypothetical protein
MSVGIASDEMQVALDLSNLFLKTMSARDLECSHSESSSDAKNFVDRQSTEASDGSTITDTDSWSEHVKGFDKNSDTCSVTSARPPWSQLMQLSLKARCCGGAAQAHSSWVSGQGARKSAQQDRLPTEALEKLKDVNTELRYEQWPDVERRWRDSLCEEKKQEDRQQRPPNGTLCPTATEGPWACFLPLKELEVLRSGDSELRTTKWAEIDSEWIATVCAEKKKEDALALHRSAERMHSADLNSSCSINRMEVLDDRINQFPVESRYSHEYYYSSRWSHEYYYSSPDELVRAAFAARP